MKDGGEVGGEMLEQSGLTNPTTTPEDPHACPWRRPPGVQLIQLGFSVDEGHAHSLPTLRVADTDCRRPLVSVNGLETQDNRSVLPSVGDVNEDRDRRNGYLRAGGCAPAAPRARDRRLRGGRADRRAHAH